MFGIKVALPSRLTSNPPAKHTINPTTQSTQPHNQPNHTINPTGTPLPSPWGEDDQQKNPQGETDHAEIQSLP